MRGVLLWTERPVLLQRELETHTWMEEHRPWEAFDLELIHDNEPGDWRHYAQSFRRAWDVAREADVPFVNAESDIVPTLEAFSALLSCREPSAFTCTVPYTVWGYNDGTLRGYSAVREERVKGGWDSGFVRRTDDWAVSCDLGLVLYPVRTLRMFPGSTIPPPTADNGLWPESVARLVRVHSRRADPVHLHWPPIGNNHVYWDEGDQAHHPPGFTPVRRMPSPRP